MSSTASTARATTRQDSLDVLRGFAILGILVINIQMFSMVSLAYVNPTLAGPMNGLDYWIWLLSHVAFQEKFLTIFSALFGAGIVLLSERMAVASGRAWYLHLRRMFVLGVIGAAHAYFIWYGDILLIYAVIGVVAFAFRNCRPRRLLIIAGALYLVPVMISIILTIVFYNLPAAYYDFVVQHYWQPTSPEIIAQTQGYRGGWTEQMAARVNDARIYHLWRLPTNHGWHVLAAMLAGMAAYRSGLLSGSWSSREYRRWGLAGLAIGLPIILLGVWFNQATGWEMLTSLFLGAEFNHLGTPFMTLAWICGLLLVWRAGWFPRLLAGLRAVGRTALSAYLLTSVICTTIFYGHGFGLFGQVTRLEQLFVVVGVWVVLIAAATAWLQHFRMGPVEWLWRWAATGSRAPLLRAA